MRHGAQASDPLVAAAQAWAVEHYKQDAPVAQMVAISGLPERTFKRRFVRATGHSPISYVQHVRVEEAKRRGLEKDEPTILPTATVEALSALIESGNPLFKDGKLWTPHRPARPETNRGFRGCRRSASRALPPGSTRTCRSRRS